MQHVAGPNNEPVTRRGSLAGAVATIPDGYSRLAAVTPSDTADLPEVPSALWVSAAGTLALVADNDRSTSGTSLGSLAVGTIVPVRASRVLATDTTATVIGLFRD